MRHCLAVAVLAASLGAVETLSQRRRRVEEMSAEQREELFRSEQQFRALPPQEQQRIRDLHEQIESAPDREKLRATMNRYCKWFETQPPFRRAKLSDKKRTLKDRIATVKEFLAKQGPAKDLHLDDRSRRALAAWLDRYTAEHGVTIHREHGPKVPTRQSPSFRPSGNKRSSARCLAALADGGPGRTDAHLGAGDGSSPRGTFAGAAREVGSQETRRTGPDRRRLAPRDGLPANSTNNWSISSRTRSAMKSAID